MPSAGNQPALMVALRQQGWQAFRRGQLAEAEDCLRRAVQQQPDDAVSHHNLGVVLAQRRRLAEALPCFEQAVRLRPDYASAHHNRGNALRDLGRAAEAVPCYEEALRLQPRHAAASFDLAVTLLALRRPRAALPHLAQAARLRPDHADTHHRLAQALAEEGRLAEAVDSYQRLSVLQPAQADVHHNLGVLLARLGRHDESVAAYRQAARLRPEYAQAHNNLGIALVETGEFEASVAAFRTAIGLDPNYAEAHNNLAITLVKLGDLEAAQASFAEALRLRPDYPKARTNRAMAWLQMGDHERGWPEYEWRWQTEDFTPRAFPQPRWDGTELAGRRILLHAEQGLGDTLQFIRYAALVQARGGVVLVEAPARLLPLLARCPGIDQLVERGKPLPDFDVQAPLLSLPALLGTTRATIPAPIPYLSADPERLASWRAVLRSVPERKIGIAWRGSPTYRGDRQRSFPLRHFEPLARLAGVRLISLQKGAGAEEVAALPPDWNVLDLGPRLDGEAGAFLDTAAVAAQLDLVICADTSLGHLAGALGVPVWLALPFAADWRWERTGDRTPWYPRTRLFRQRRAGDWHEVFTRMAAELQAQAIPTGSAAPLVVPVSPGELLDKITILEIKQARFRDAVKRGRVQTELAALAAARAQLRDEPAEWSSLIVELKTVNERLWDVEDALRLCERDEDFGSRFVTLARSVYQLNDRRAQLKRCLNEGCGSALMEEKEYAAAGEAAPLPEGAAAPAEDQ